MRKWPVAIKLDRQCTRDFDVCDEQTGATLFTLPRGSYVWIPAYAIHHDPAYYPRPECFDPERFAAGRREEIRPFTFLGLGVGPRNCIGSRFAVAEVKVFLVEMLAQFTFEVAAQTETRPRLVSGECVLRAPNGIWVQLRPRRQRTRI